MDDDWRLPPPLRHHLVSTPKLDTAPKKGVKRARGRGRIHLAPLVLPDRSPALDGRRWVRQNKEECLKIVEVGVRVSGEGLFLH